MLLDNLERYTELDTLGMGDHIDGLPDQIEAAWAHAQMLPLPRVGDVANVVICGMGGSAIGGALLKSLLASECPAPIESVRDYDLPAYVGPNTLVIGSSHSGNTEETLAAIEAAAARGAQLVSFSTGGVLAQRTPQLGGTHWHFDYASQPRAAIGYALMLPLALLSRLGLVRDFSADVKAAVATLRMQQQTLKREAPLAQNPAKRLAGQFIERFIILVAAEPLAPVARRWAGQIAENGKAWAQHLALPEMDHNAVAGIELPAHLAEKTMVFFLESSQAHARNQARVALTRELFTTAGYNTDALPARGDTRLEQMLSALHFGDYMSYYLAIAYGVDPTPIDTLVWFKEQLATVQTDHP